MNTIESYTESPNMQSETVITPKNDPINLAHRLPCPSSLSSSQGKSSLFSASST